MQAIMELKEDEHSVGMANRSLDMQDIFEVVNNLEIKDICSSGIHFTWTKSLKHPKCYVLKKLDRIMANDEFMKQASSLKDKLKRDQEAVDKNPCDEDARIKAAQGNKNRVKRIRDEDANMYEGSKVAD
ncbi:hypothetical protein Tco_1213901 [Tanacetum coccineum]